MSFHSSNVLKIVFFSLWFFYDFQYVKAVLHVMTARWQVWSPPCQESRAWKNHIFSRIKHNIKINTLHVSSWCLVCTGRSGGRRRMSAETSTPRQSQGAYIKQGRCRTSNKVGAVHQTRWVQDIKQGGCRTSNKVGGAAVNCKPLPDQTTMRCYNL